LAKITSVITDTAAHVQIRIRAALVRLGIVGKLSLDLAKCLVLALQRAVIFASEAGETGQAVAPPVAANNLAPPPVEALGVGLAGVMLLGRRV
jgi:hypothetical protein